MVSSTTSTSSSGTLFAIGDLQGCLESLEELLTQLPQDAELLFVGDLVNRGPQSLQTLRFVKNLGSRARSILGNHDLHLLAVAAGAGEMHKKDTIADILSAPDRDELINWLRNQPLLIEQGDVLFAHAGIHPLWDLSDLALAACKSTVISLMGERYVKTRQFATKTKGAQEAHEALAGPQWQRWLQGMYGNTQWSPDLTGEKRMRAILNGFTRMRFVNALTGELDFDLKEGAGTAPKGWVPWFEYKHRLLCDHTICFGHWSMLGLINRPNLVAIDTGCLWGGELTAVRFPDRRIFQEKCPCWANPLAFSKKHKKD